MHREVACEPVRFGEYMVQVSTSIGIALFPEHASGVDHLFAAADTALYMAKRQGRGRFAWASPSTVADAPPAPLAWNAAHEVGIADMDMQHAHLASLLNELVGVLRNAEDYNSPASGGGNSTSARMRDEARRRRDELVLCGDRQNLARSHLGGAAQQAVNGGACFLHRSDGAA
jgi:hypothetical protein